VAELDGLVVEDLQEQRRFYRDVLGFQELDGGDGDALAANPSLDPAVGVPGLDDELIGRLADAGQHDLSDVDAYPSRRFAGALRIRGLDGNARYLRVARPPAWVVLGWILRRAVQREARVASEVERLHRARHHAHPQLPVGELGLDATDARRPIPAERRERLVLSRVEQSPNASGELGLGRLELAPRAQG